MPTCMILNRAPSLNSCGAIQRDYCFNSLKQSMTQPMPMLALLQRQALRRKKIAQGFAANKQGRDKS